MSAPAPQKIIFTNDITPILVSLAAEMTPSSVFVVTDANVAAKVLPSLGLPSEWEVIAVPPGDTNKDLDSLALIWRSLTSGGATRKSLVVNIGGGVVTDMGGFAAATFKRGVRFINVPTTLLSAVDAAVGGKTGINFEGYKNEIGVFANADAVVISTVTFSTLPPAEILSGYAEMIKHSLLEDRESFGRLLAFDISEADADRLLHLLEESVRVKERIVTADPREKGIRRALNLGHTVGHAFESIALERHAPVPHGQAVAWGTLVEMILSHIKTGFPSGHLHTFASYLKNQGYGVPSITCDDYPRLISLMRHDKKNDTPDAINFTLLREVGEPMIDQTACEEEIKTALDIFRDLLQ